MAKSSFTCILCKRPMGPYSCALCRRRVCIECVCDCEASRAIDVAGHEKHEKRVGAPLIEHLQAKHTRHGAQARRTPPGKEAPR